MRFVTFRLTTCSTETKSFYASDEPNPLSVTEDPNSRANSELGMQIRRPRARTGLSSARGRPFLSAVVTRARSGEVLQAISDARGTRLCRRSAARLRELAVRGNADLFHVVNSGTGASYEEFVRLALEIAALEQTQVIPVTVQALNRPAPRPANSCLRCLASESLGLALMPNWKDALERFVAQESQATDSAGSVVTVQPERG